MPIGNGAMKDRTFVEWDKDALEALGLMKVDVLGLGMLTCIRKAFELLAHHKGLHLTLASVPQDDPAVYDMLCRADTVGVFQIESRAQMNMLPRLKPRRFYDLVIEVAIVRPGPIQGDMVHPYLRRRDGLEEVIYPAPAPEHGPPDELRRVLEKTLGVPLFQEQAMRLAMEAAKFTPDEADALRRAMATFRRRGTLSLLKEKMVGRMVARGYDPELAERCFRQIEGFGDYGFPESHAASFALLAYVSSWLKCHHPDAFACALLNAQPMGFYAPAQIVRDAREHGVEVRPVDVNASGWDNSLEDAGEGRRAECRALRLGLRQVGGLRQEDAARIVDARDVDARRAPYPDVGTLARRAGISASAIETLAGADAFRSMGLDRRQALWQARALAKAPPLPLFEAADQRGEGREPAVALPAMADGEQVVEDYRTLRLSLHAHPLAFLRERLAGRGALAAEAMARARDGDRAAAAGLVLVRQRPGSAKGVIFMTLEDETGTVNVVVWPNILERYRQAVLGGRLAMVRGRVQRAGEIVHLVAAHVEDLTHWLDLLTPDQGSAQPSAGAPPSRTAGATDGGPPRRPHATRATSASSRAHGISGEGGRDSLSHDEGTEHALDTICGGKHKMSKKWAVKIADEFQPEFDRLQEDVQDAILTMSRMLQQLGPQLGRPQVDTLKGSRHANMKEMRFSAADGEWRLAFAFDPKRRAMFLVAGDKSGGSARRFYRALIRKADERFDRHLARLAQEGGL